MDQAGRPRELHLPKALAVTNLSFEPRKSEERVLERNEDGVKSALLREQYFCLDRLTQCQRMPIKPDQRYFQILTAIEDGSMTIADGDVCPLTAGQTVLVPAEGETFTITGPHFLCSYPTVD